MTTTVATDYDNIEIQQQYSDVNNRWDVDDWDNENSSARLFERSRIKALAGRATAGNWKSAPISQNVAPHGQHSPGQPADHCLGDHTPQDNRLNGHLPSWRRVRVFQSLEPFAH